MIKRVFKMLDGTVQVWDENLKHLPEFEGDYEEKKGLIMASVAGKVEWRKQGVGGGFQGISEKDF
ncbi:MAG: hypothetical protein GY861_08305 [bacterium]|nr:hypothetical protein [bacterium]